MLKKRARGCARTKSECPCLDRSVAHLSRTTDVHFTKIHHIFKSVAIARMKALHSVEYVPFKAKAALRGGTIPLQGQLSGSLPTAFPPRRPLVRASARSGLYWGKPQTPRQENPQISILSPQKRSSHVMDRTHPRKATGEATGAKKAPSG